LANKEGKSFESAIETSSSEQGIFYHRIKDVFIPPDLRQRIRVPKNKYDSFMFYNRTLFPVEFKSIQAKSISIKDPKIIKPHQIEALTEALNYPHTIPGFIFNFREYDNQTFFVHIRDFNIYRQCAMEEICEREYKSKINKSSISLDICKEIGTELKNVKKVKRYRYYVKELLDELIRKYS
jgi:penicillin-binding protein-related factor A (putative recombinase)